MEVDTANKLLEPGCIAVIPTDTVYGLVARAEDNSAVKRLYDLKNRDQKPGTLIAANIEQLEALGLKHRYLKSVEQYWPGPISVIIPASNPELQYLHLGKLSLAVRIPSDKKLVSILLKTGPLLTSSANPPGKKPAETIEMAKQYFDQRVDFYEDGGDLSAKKPSTLIRVIDDAVDVLRQGAGEL
jgi:L-threonylcarbamoyladenylate synthase